MLKTGDSVILRCGGRSVDAEVAFASPSGQSVMFIFEAIIAGHVGMMPAFMRDATHGEVLVTGEPIELEVLP
jgi:hypothetical protein